ncbi:MAG: hypothetical protein ACK4SX_01190 [Alcanivoracaceae bacterium]
MRWLVSIFFGSTLLLFIVQRAFKDENYFIPTMVVVLLANFIIIFSVDISQFDNIEDMGAVLSLLLERPQLILYFGLLMMAAAPPVLWGGSFTFYFSKIDWPVDDWQNPEFVLANKKISYFWVVVFLLCFLSQFVPVLIVQLFSPIIIVMTLGVWGTRRMIDLFVNQLEATEE